MSDYHLLQQSKKNCLLVGKGVTLSFESSKPPTRFLSTWSWIGSKLGPAGQSQQGEHCASPETDTVVHVDQPVNKDPQTGQSLQAARLAVVSSASQSTAPVSLRAQPASPNSKPTGIIASEFWSHRLFKSRDGGDIVVDYCETLESSEQVAQLFLNDTLLGFDMEWQPEASKYDSIQNNASLIQLASRDRIALFHISKFRPGTSRDHLVPPTLKRILESSDITKAGVAIRADSTRLRTFLGINPRGLFELSHLYRLVKYYHQPSEINKRLVGMSKQIDEHFGLSLLKDRSVRCSNWSSSLTESQVHYAAADAYAGYQLFCVMDAKRRAMDPTPPLPAYAELNLPIRMFSRPSSNGSNPVEIRAVAPVSSPRGSNRSS
ncbi:ribonuclease H-like domain-containing protein [Aspergillus pseudoustus]|uniref:Ribonuclease H-like domain-containing protein n=1 Tax=Aspergillus pseudoustus TaxID=1810923 RepID=A0ABR4L2X3_9EURO